MMDDECACCYEKFEDGQDIMMHEYDFGKLYFCSSLCAGYWFVESECQSMSFTRSEDDNTDN